MAIPALTSTTARATELLQTTPRGPRPPHRMLHQEIVQQLLAMVEAALGPEPRVLFYCFAILGIAPCV